MIETLDDIVEELADALGVYGACYEEVHERLRGCRVCFTSSLKTRISAAVEIERRLKSTIP